MSKPTEEEIRKQLKQIVKLEAAIKAEEAEIAEIEALYLKKLRDKVKANKDTVAQIRESATIDMVNSGITSLFDAQFKATLRDIKPKVEVVNEKKIPDNFIELVRKVRKADINAYYKETGKVPAGCELTEGAWTLAIETA